MDVVFLCEKVSNKVILGRRGIGGHELIRLEHDLISIIRNNIYWPTIKTGRVMTRALRTARWSRVLVALLMTSKNEWFRIRVFESEIIILNFLKIDSKLSRNKTTFDSLNFRIFENDIFRKLEISFK